MWVDAHDQLPEIPKETARDWPRRGTAVCYGYFVILVLPVLPTAAAVREENSRRPRTSGRDGL
jgi:hypothetical protein